MKPWPEGWDDPRENEGEGFSYSDRSMTSGFPPGSFGLARNPRQSSKQQPGMSHGVPCRPSMFTKQVSRPMDGLDPPNRARRGGAGRANSKKELVSGPIRGICALQVWPTGGDRRVVRG